MLSWTTSAVTSQLYVAQGKRFLEIVKLFFAAFCQLSRTLLVRENDHSLHGNDDYLKLSKDLIIKFPAFEDPTTNL